MLKTKQFLVKIAVPNNLRRDLFSDLDGHFGTPLAAILFLVGVVALKVMIECPVAARLVFSVFSIFFLHHKLLSVEPLNCLEPVNWVGFNFLMDE